MAQSITLQDLKPGMEFQGRVTRVELFGAFVEVAPGVEGLVHISQLREERVTRVADVVKVGDEVTVWVREVHPEIGRLDLTMIRPPAHPIRSLEKGMQLTGRVTGLTEYGAFVDIGSEVEGLVHISRMGQERIRHPKEVVKPGDEVTVWVHDVDPDAQRISLTMVPPPRRPIDTLKPGMIVDGVVTRLAPFGAFVDIGAERDGLVHVQEMAPGYVNDPSEVLKVGDEVQVRILSVDRRKRQIDLSLKEALEEEFAVLEEEDDEPLVSPLEWAFKQAMEQQERKKARRKGKKQRKSFQDDQAEEIIRRTLQLKEEDAG